MSMFDPIVPLSWYHHSIELLRGGGSLRVGYFYGFTAERDGSPIAPLMQIRAALQTSGQACWSGDSQTCPLLRDQLEARNQFVRLLRDRMEKGQHHRPPCSEVFGDMLLASRIDIPEIAFEQTRRGLGGQSVAERDYV